MTTKSTVSRGQVTVISETTVTPTSIELHVTYKRPLNLTEEEAINLEHWINDGMESSFSASIYVFQLTGKRRPKSE